VGGGGGGTTLAGDGLVLVSLLLSATVTVAQGRLLTGRDPVAVTAVQFLGATLGALPVAALSEGAPAMPAGAGQVLAVVALALGGTLLPFTLFAFGQSRVSAEVAGAFLNLEPLVGAIAGAAAFGDPVGLAQVAGGLAILVGIGLSSLPLFAGRRAETRRVATATSPAPRPAAAPAAPAVFVVIRGGKFGVGRPGGPGDRARGRGLLQVGGQEGQVGGRQAVAGGLGLVPVGVEQRRGAGRVELGPLVVTEGEVCGGQVVGRPSRSAVPRAFISCQEA